MKRKATPSGSQPGTATEEQPVYEHGHPSRQQAAAARRQSLDRSELIASGLRTTAAWSVRFIIIVAALALALWLLGQIWVGVFPVILALIVCTVLWPATHWLRRHRVPPALAAVTTILVSFLLFVAVMAAIAPLVVDQGGEIVDRATQGVDEVTEWLAGPPVNLDNEQISQAVDQATSWAQERSSDIASGVMTGASAVGSGLITLALVLVLVFFFLKDGPKFLPWVRQVAGEKVGNHLTEVLTRTWHTLAGFIRAQAMVSAFDAVFIGLGLVIMGIPLALPLAVLTFFAGFIPIVGAVTAGALAVLVALVTNGFTSALIVLAIVVAVQQIESNVLQPFLQGRSMHLHAGIVLLSIAGGSTLFGIIGAFLAVPLAASVVVVLRYASEQIDLRAGAIPAAHVHPSTPEGSHAAHDGEVAAEENVARMQARRKAHRVPTPPKATEQAAKRERKGKSKGARGWFARLRR